MKTTARDINVIDLTVPRDRRKAITLFYAVKGKGQPSVSLPASSGAGKLVTRLTEMIAKYHDDPHYH